MTNQPNFHFAEETIGSRERNNLCRLIRLVNAEQGAEPSHRLGSSLEPFPTLWVFKQEFL